MSRQFVLALCGESVKSGRVKIVGCAEADVAEAAGSVEGAECLRAVEVDDHAEAVEGITDLNDDRHEGDGIFPMAILKGMFAFGTDATDEIVAVLEANAEETGEEEEDEEAGADDGDGGRTKVAALPEFERRTRKDGTPRAVRTKKKNTEWMFEEGLIAKGDVVTVKPSRGVERPNSEATVVDGKIVSFKGKEMVYNAWIEKVTGSRGATVYKYAIGPDGRSFEQIRSGIKLEDLKAKGRPKSAAPKKARAPAPRKAAAPAETKEAPKESVFDGDSSANPQVGGDEAERMQEEIARQHGIAVTMRQKKRFADNGFLPVSAAVMHALITEGIERNDFFLDGKKVAVFHAIEFVPFLVAAGAEVSYVTGGECEKSRAFIETAVKEGSSYETMEGIVDHEGAYDLVISTAMRTAGAEAASAMDFPTGMDILKDDGKFAIVMPPDWRGEGAGGEMREFALDWLSISGSEDGEAEFGEAVPYDSAVFRKGPVEGLTAIVGADGAESEVDVSDMDAIPDSGFDRAGKPEGA